MRRVFPPCAPTLSLVARLDLNGLASFTGISRNDHQITLFRLRAALHDLPDRANRVNDSRSRRVRHEGRERLDSSTAVRLRRQREHVGLIWLKTGDGGLYNLCQSLIEESNRGGDLLAPLTIRVDHRQMRGRAGDA